MAGETPNQEVATRIEEVLAYSFNLFASFAWQAMGFVPDPATGKTRVALDEAQMAIDCADFIAGKLRTRIEPEARKDIERILRDLKVNFLDKRAETSNREA